MPIVSNSWWVLSCSHNVSSKYLLFIACPAHESWNALWSPKQPFYRWSNCSPKRQFCWWLSHVQGKSPQTPDEQAISKSKRMYRASPQTVWMYCNCTFCKSRAQGRSKGQMVLSSPQKSAMFPLGSFSFVSVPVHLYKQLQHFCTPDPICSQQKQLNGRSGTRNDICVLSFIHSK